MPESSTVKETYISERVDSACGSVQGNVRIRLRGTQKDIVNIVYSCLVSNNASSAKLAPKLCVSVSNCEHNVFNHKHLATYVRILIASVGNM